MSSLTAQAVVVDYDAYEELFGEPISLSVTGKPMRAHEAPAATHILTQEDIRQSGAKNLSQLLRHIPGIEVQRAFADDAYVVVRGVGLVQPPDVMFLLNGRQMHSPHVNSFNPSHLPVRLSEIRQVEVIKGPGTAMYGFTAGTGVVNIITYDPIISNLNEMKLSFGTREYEEVSFVKSFKLDEDLAVRFSGEYQASDGFNRDGITNFANKPHADDAYSKHSAHLDVQWEDAQEGLWRFQGSRTATNADSNILFWNRVRDRRYSTSEHLSYQREAWDSLWKLDVSHYGHDTQNATAATESDMFLYRVENLKDWGADWTSRLTLEHVNARARGPQYANNEADYNLYAIGGMAEWRATDDLTLTNSVRYDYYKLGRSDAQAFGVFAANPSVFDRAIEEVSFNSAAVYRVTDQDTIRFSIGRGVTMPSLSKSSNEVPPFVHGNPTMQPQRLLSFELGYRHDQPEIDGSWNVNVFRDYHENVTEVLSNGSFTYFDNLGEVEVTGVEVSFDQKKDTYKWGANYTYISADDLDNPGIDELFFEERQVNHQFSIYGYRTEGPWEYGGDLNYLSGIDYRSRVGITNTAADFDTDEINGYFVLNTRVAYSLDDKTTISLEGDNLIDKHRETIMSDAGPLGPSGGNNLGKRVTLTYTKKF